MMLVETRHVGDNILILHIDHVDRKPEMRLAKVMLDWR